jgi:hypothetical protein
MFILLLLQLALQSLVGFDLIDNCLYRLLLFLNPIDPSIRGCYHCFVTIYVLRCEYYK